MEIHIGKYVHRELETYRYFITNQFYTQIASELVGALV